MRDLTKLRKFMELVEELIQHASKEEIGETARLLALNVTHYEMKYGMLPLEDELLPENTENFTDEHCELVTRSMETLAGVLGNVMQGMSDTARH